MHAARSRLDTLESGAAMVKDVMTEIARRGGAAVFSPGRQHELKLGWRDPTAPGSSMNGDAIAGPQETRLGSRQHSGVHQYCTKNRWIRWLPPHGRGRRFPRLNQGGVDSFCSAVPVGVQDRGHLGELGGDEADALLGKAGDNDLDVEHVIDAPFRENAAGREIQVLEALENAGKRAGVRVGGDAESEDGPVGRHELGSWYALRELRAQTPGLSREAGQVMRESRTAELMVERGLACSQLRGHAPPLAGPLARPRASAIRGVPDRAPRIRIVP